MDWPTTLKELTGLVTACGVIVIGVLQYMQRAKVESVRKDLKNKHTDTDRKLDAVAEKVEAVHLATNSLTDRLVATTEAEALARGGVEERARADSRKAGGG